jgi:NAD(P)-dependent dehydrogenase (short-subunit alcohol dehydrogenase family)
VDRTALPPILVTGASSGIGHHLTNHLAERGHAVFATARRDDDLTTLGQIENVTPIRLDVTRPEEIRDAVRIVEDTGRGLHGLVNNAGIGSIGYLHTVSDEEMQEIFETNLLGPHRMVNAFLDLLLASKGRVVNIGSMGGLVTMKLFGPYSVTKFGLEAYTIALRAELEEHGVKVSIVEPGGIVSKIGENSEAGVRARLERAGEPFQEEAEQMLAQLGTSPGFDESQPESAVNRRLSSPEIVSVAAYAALFSDEPRAGYLVGTRWEGDRVFHALFDKLLEMNDAPQHGYSREQLVAMLDQHLSDRGGLS